MTPAELNTLILSQPVGGAVRTAYAAGADSECARLLRESTAPRQALPPLTTPSQFIAFLSPESFAGVFDHPRYREFAEAFEIGDRAAVLRWAAAFRLRGLVTADELANATAFLTTPTTQELPLVPGCTHEMVSAAREAA